MPPGMCQDQICIAEYQRRVKASLGPIAAHPRPRSEGCRGDLRSRDTTISLVLAWQDCDLVVGVLVRASTMHAPRLCTQQQQCGEIPRPRWRDMIQSGLKRMGSGGGGGCSWPWGKESTRTVSLASSFLGSTPPWHPKATSCSPAVPHPNQGGHDGLEVLRGAP